MSCVQSSQSSIMYYLKLRNEYHAQCHKRRKSSLWKEIEKVDTRIKSLTDLIGRACKIKQSLSSGLSAFMQSCIQKQALLTQIGQALLTISNITSNKSLLNSLRRRLLQQKATRRTGQLVHVVQCHNTMTWEAAYNALDNLLNSGTSGKDCPLSFHHLRRVSMDVCTQ